MAEGGSELTGQFLLCYRISRDFLDVSPVVHNHIPFINKSAHMCPRILLHRIMLHTQKTT